MASTLWGQDDEAAARHVLDMHTKLLSVIDSGYKAIKDRRWRSSTGSCPADVPDAKPLGDH